MQFSGFYKSSIEERLAYVKEYAQLSEVEIMILKNTGALGLDIANRMIENVIGVTHLPLGLGVNFKINGKEYAIPMAVEEPSVVAAVCNCAKLTLPDGFYARVDEPIMIGQIQIVGVENAEETKKKLEAKRTEIEKIARELLKSMETRGGGFKDFYMRAIKTERGEMLIVYFDIDVRDAMGANTINTMLEGIAPSLKNYVGKGKIRLRILSNFADKRKASAKAVWKKEVVGEEAIEGILDGYEFAKADIYRATTHNKGIMNGIDALAIATGNDWRAIEAGAHAYASRNGKYQPLTHYEKDSVGNLIGTIELPMALGIVGGSINSNPVASIALKILNVKNAKELAMVAACVGLANNFAALKALATEGIQKGHMKLHARNLAVIAGANTNEEIEKVVCELEKSERYTINYAKEILNKIRSK
ncbi:MAG: hydroxymethylglutaryl-CoA reductase, degradative [Candidatus Micrarchaeota archaeon]